MNSQFFRTWLILLISAAAGLSAPVYEIRGTELLSYSWKNTDAVFVVPEDVESIAPGCFAGQWRNPVLRKLVFPAGLKHLPAAFWQGCLESLEAIEVSPENSCFRSCDGVLFSHDGSRLICYPPRRPGLRYSVPEQVVELGDWSFRDCALLENVRLPRTLRKIGAGAFYDCRRLRSLTVPAEVRMIGTDAFRRWRDAGTFQILYDSRLFLEHSANPYGPPADASATMVFMPGPLPAEHYQTCLQQGIPYLFTIRPGWNLYYLPADHPVFAREKIFSYLRIGVSPSKRCYITHDGSSPEGGLYWLFSDEEQPVEFQGIVSESLEIPEDRSFFHGWRMKTFAQLEKEKTDIRIFHFWDSWKQKFQKGDTQAALPAETPVWIPQP